MQELWVRWEPLSSLGKKYNIEYVINSRCNGFKIILSDTKEGQKGVEVFFENGVSAYRDTNESFRLTLLGELSQAYGAYFYGQWTFFKVTNSRYIHWVEEEEGPGSLDIEWFKHFCFVAQDTVVDVVSTYEPVVRFIERDPGDRHE